VPNDTDHVMYVWFDALVNYVSAIGWPNDLEKFNKFGKESGGMVQYCGKDNLRQQSAMWQAMLFAADLPNSKKVIINGFITGEGGVKMSKSLGNVIDPNDVVKEFGKEALRFFLCHELSPFEDSPFTMDRMKNSYNSFLANGIGNLISRITKMAVGVSLKVDNINEVQKELESSDEWKEYSKAFDEFNIQNASQVIWKMIKNTDEYIQRTEPFKVVKVDLEEGKKHILKLLVDLAKISILLKPIMPDTAEIALRCIVDGVVPEKPVFMRIK
ncbi:MAG: class I tRNA ligase family protein, partial [bacterium]|nr:class I tRNA ligase family protein [bacterium]